MTNFSEFQNSELKFEKLTWQIEFIGVDWDKKKSGMIDVINDNERILLTDIPWNRRLKLVDLNSSLDSNLDSNRLNDLYNLESTIHKTS